MSARWLEQVDQALGYSFGDAALAQRALCHRSAVADNEQLEYLGDAVLGMLVSEYLVRTFPHWSEGQLSKSRASLVNAASLCAAAKRLGLGEHMLLGRGEEKTGGREKPALLADAFEAVLAAIYLEGGLGPARELLKKTVFLLVQEDGERIWESDRKSALQEFLQGKGEPPAEYRLAGETGPDHQKTFLVEAWVKGECLAQAQGSTKKEAEQKAAKSALIKLLEVESSESAEVGPNGG